MLARYDPAFIVKTEKDRCSQIFGWQIYCLSLIAAMNHGPILAIAKYFRLLPLQPVLLVSREPEEIAELDMKLATRRNDQLEILRFRLRVRALISIIVVQRQFDPPANLTMEFAAHRATKL